MPVVLSQHFSPADRVYEDAEFSLYHYPRAYFSRIRRYEPFIYYRPLGDSRRRDDSMTYFGHGVLGEWYDDYRKPGHRFVNILRGQRFPQLVPLRNPRGNYYETETTSGPQFQAAVRELSPLAYHSILAAAGLSQADLDVMPDTDAIAASPYPLPIVAGADRRFARNQRDSTWRRICTSRRFITGKRIRICRTTRTSAA